MQFTNHFTITKKDNTRYNFYIMRKKLISTAAVVFVIIAATLALMRYAQGMDIQSAIANALLMAVFGTVLLLGVNVISTFMRINNFYKQKKLVDFSVDFTVDKDGIHATSDRGDSDLPWNRIVSIQETRNAFYIFITDTHANVMPKDQIVSETGVATLRGLFEKNLDKSRLKLKSGN